MRKSHKRNTLLLIMYFSCCVIFSCKATIYSIIVANPENFIALLLVKDVGCIINIVCTLYRGMNFIHISLNTIDIIIKI